MDVDDHFDGFDQNTDAMFFEGDLGYIVGGLTGQYAPFDLPFAVGLIPLVLQNGIWLEDGFVGAAATIPARNSPGLDISNFDTTFFVGFDELTTPALSATTTTRTSSAPRRSSNAAAGTSSLAGRMSTTRRIRAAAITTSACRTRGGISTSCRTRCGRSSTRGQSGPEDQRTADGVLLLMENSLITPMPYNVVPYLNLFAGFDRPQPLGRLQGPLKNTGINFESDLLTGYPILDDSANNTYGGALGVDLLGAQFDRQLIVEAAMVQAFDDPADANCPGRRICRGRAVPEEDQQLADPPRRRDARLDRQRQRRRRRPRGAAAQVLAGLRGIGGIACMRCLLRQGCGTRRTMPYLWAETRRRIHADRRWRKRRATPWHRLACGSPCNRRAAIAADARRVRSGVRLRRFSLSRCGAPLDCQ